MLVKCECCSELRSSTWVRRLKGTTVISIICSDCSSGGHFRDFCVLCHEPVWHCARVDHVAKAHPGMMERLTNDPFKELQDAEKKKPRIIGRIEW